MTTKTAAIASMNPSRLPSKPSLATILLLAAFPALSPLSIDLGQPAMPLVAAALGATRGQTGLTLSLFMAGFALAQLVAGPVSDRVGRKPPLVVGSMIYALAGLGCALAPSICLLVLTRLLQGLGAGTCVVLAYAVIRDRYEGAVARLCLSSINAMMWLAPVIAPALGVGLLALGGWRLVYAVLAASGAVLVVLAAAGFTESLRRPDRASLAPRRVFANYRAVLTHRSAIAHATLVGLSFGGLFAYVAGASWAFLGYLGLSQLAFAATFASVGAGLSAGSILCARLAARGASGRRVTGVGVIGLFATSLVLLGVAMAEAFTVASAVPILFLNALAIGLAMPGAVQGAMQPFPAMAGTASAVQGCLRMVGAAASSALVALLSDGTPVAMAFVMTAFAGAGVLVWRVAIGGVPAPRAAAATVAR